MQTTTIRRIAVFILTLLSANIATADWVQSLRKDNTAYFLCNLTPRIERYALTNGQWLEPINLPSIHGLPTAFWVDEAGIYVAYDKSVKGYDLSGNGEFHFINTAAAILNVFTDGHVLLVNHTAGYYANFTTLNKTNGTLIDTFENYIDSTYGSCIAPSINKIFGRSMGVSPSDITYVSYSDDGMLINGGDSPHHGDYPGATRTWVFPGDSKVVDDSGTVYSTGSLTYVNSFGGRIDDLAFYGADIPIVLRGAEIIAYTKTMAPAGSRLLTFTPRTIFVADTNVFTFTVDNSRTNGIRANIIPVSTLNPPTPGEPVNPSGLVYTPDNSFVDTNGVLYLFSKAHESLFRWDTVGQRYLTSIPLLDVPAHCAYSEESHKVYIAYPSGLVRQMDLSDTNFAETALFNLPGTPLGLATAGKYIFACDPSGAWATHYTFAPDGTMADSQDWNYFSTEYIWNGPNQRMYFLRDDTSPNDLHSEPINADNTVHTNLPLGGLGVDMESPLHTSTGFTHPIRVSPDGSLVVLGSGVIHNAKTLARLATSLANSIQDAAWTDGQLRTMRTISGLTQLQQWVAPNFALGTVRQFPGEAHRLFSLNTNRLVAITLAGGIPNFHVLNGHFQIIAPAVLASPTILNPLIVSTSQVKITWLDVSGEEEYVVERKTGTNGTWQTIGTTVANTTVFRDGAVTGQHIYHYRVTAKNGSNVSNPSAVVSAALITPPTPVNVIASTLSAVSVGLTWDDTQYESSYVIQQRIGAVGSWIQLATPAGNATNYVVTNLTPDTQYWFRIRATNAIGASTFSELATATTDAMPPTTPGIYYAYANPFSVQLSWQYSRSTYATGYVLERRTPDSDWDVRARLGADTLYFIDESVAHLTTYEYRLYGTNRVGRSAYSSPVTVTMPAEPVPAAPMNFVAKGVSSSLVSLAWSDVRIERGYLLQRRTEYPSSWTDLATLPADTRSYADTSVVAGMQYFYRVAAFNDSGLSDFSNENDAVPMDRVALIEDDFDPALNSMAWLATSGAFVTNGGAGFHDGNALWFGGGGTRSAVTIPLNIQAGATVEFLMRAGNETVDGNDFWNNSDSDEWVLMEYSGDGLQWQIMAYLDTQYPLLNEWTEFSIQVPMAAYGSNVRFRFRQYTQSGPGYDVWAIENFAVYSTAPPAPAAPEFVVARSTSPSSITVFWTAVSGATSYVVERKVDNGTWSQVAVVGSPTTYFVDVNALQLLTHSYRVKARNAGGASPPSMIASVVTTATLTVNATPFEAGGYSVDVPQPDEGYPLGTEVTVTAVPYGTNVFSAWHGSKASLSPQVSLTMNGNQTLNALYNNPGKLLFQNVDNGKLALWFMEGTQRLASVPLHNGVSTHWRLSGAGDFTGDGTADLVIRSPEGQIGISVMNGNIVASNFLVRGGIPLNAGWKLIGIGDVNMDSSNDMILANTSTHKLAAWTFNGTEFLGAVQIQGGIAVNSDWRPVAVADFNQDRNADLLFQRTTGEVVIWLMNGQNRSTVAHLRDGKKTTLRAIAAGDFNGDNHPDVLFRNSNRQLIIWELQQTNYVGGAYLNGAAPLPVSWSIRAVK